MDIIKESEKYFPEDVKELQKTQSKSIDMEKIRQYFPEDVKEIEKISPKPAKIPNIDYDRLSLWEGGNRHQGYVPTLNSGVTIGIGFDLKSKSVEDLKRMGISDVTIQRLTPYLGLSGEAAEKAIKDEPLIVTDQNELNELNRLSKAYYVNRIARQYEQVSGGKKFVDLDPVQQTILFSVGYQYGSFKKKDGSDMNFIKQAAAGDWKAVHKELMNFGDKHSIRRKAEAAYLEKYLYSQ